MNIMKHKALMPSVINLELTNRCNLGCVFCDHSILASRMRLGEIEASLLVTLLKQIDGYHIYELGLVGLGEPLLDMNLKTHLAEIIKFKKNFVRISLNSNGTLMDNERTEIILNSPINLVTFSLNATNGKAYKTLMGKDLFSRVVNNIKRFIKERKARKRDDMNVSVQYVSSDLNDEQELRKAFYGYLDDAVIIYNRRIFNKPAVERLGKNLVNVNVKDFSTRSPCWSIYDRVYIDIDGNVYPCTIGNDCYRSPSELCIGNAKDAELIDIFNNDRMRAARLTAERGRLPFSECARCTSWDIFPNNFKLVEGKWLRAQGAKIRRKELDRTD